MDATNRTEGLLDWQWSHYPEGHRDRTNLALHAATVPLFWLGGLAIASSAAFGLWLGPAGALAMIAAIVVQGRGHAREGAKPLPFRGPADVVVRLFVEQCVTFPRFVLSGGFAAAWREAR